MVLFLRSNFPCGVRREADKDAILLLDEPGIDLHPTAQQELISFFDELAERNMLIYTTHSPIPT